MSVVSQPPIVVSVAPTATVISTVDTSRTKLLSVSVTNLDLTQTLACVVQRRSWPSSISAVPEEWNTSSLPDLSEILPGTTQGVDIDVAANSEIRLVGTASGAGLDAIVSCRPSTL